MSDLYNIAVTTIDGTDQTLAAYKGKTLLIVNVASKCGLTPQYTALEALYKKYQDRGLVVLGFPCNQFAGQEPGSEAEISEFCQLNYGVSFPLFAKLDVNGDQRHPLYTHMLEALPGRTFSAGSDFVAKLKNFGVEALEGDILWNFEKFLVSAEGEVVGHFAPDMAPDDAILQTALADNLPA